MSFLLLLLLLFGFQAEAALPADAQAYLNKIPNQRLSLNYVIKIALLNADAYKIIGLDYATAGLEEQATLSPQTDTYLTGGYDYTDDNSSKTSAFQALRFRQAQWNLGLNKKFSTGTTTSVGWTQEMTNQEFASSSGGFDVSAFNITNFQQTFATLGLEQSLLKDSFGYAFRKKRKGARLRAQAIQWKSRNDFENTTLSFIVEYYGAWLGQQQVASLSAQVARQKRLVRVLSNRAKKGAVEKPDLIQIKALLSATETRLSKAKADLRNTWEKLVIGLKLPESFLLVEPMDVPTTIDNPVSLSLRVCGQKEPIKTAEIYALEKQLESLDSDFKAAKNESLPDLKLVAGYRGNAIDGRASTNFQNILDGVDDNGFGRGPAWNVGVKLNWPLDNSAAAAQRAQKFIDKERTTARLQGLSDSLRNQWRDSCRRLKLESENEKLFQQVVQQQQTRVRAEEKRFRLGRITVSQLVTAEDDLGSWEFQSQQKSIEVRQLAWRVQQYSGELYRNLQPMIEPMLKGKVQ